MRGQRVRDVHMQRRRTSPGGMEKPMSFNVEHKAMAPYAYPLDGRTLRVVVRAGKGTLVSVTAVYGDRYSPIEESEAVRLGAGRLGRHVRLFPRRTAACAAPVSLRVSCWMTAWTADG